MTGLFGLGEGEVPRSLRLLSLVFVASMALVLLKAAQRGIFLCAYASTAIPWAFAVSAMLLGTLSAVAVMAAGRLGPARLAMTTLALSAAASLALRGLLVTGLHAAPFVLYVVIEAIAGLVLIQTWSVVAGTVNPRSAKRLLPIAGVGAGVAWTLGGMVVAPLVGLIGAPGLLVAAPLLLGAAAVLVERIARLDVVPSAVRPVPTGTRLLEGWRRGLAYSFAVPLMRISMIVSVLALLGEQLMDFQILASAHDRFATEAESTTFFGRFYGVTSAVALVIQLGLASHILARLGAVRSLLITPVTTGVFAIATLLAPGFVPIALLRGSDRVLKSALFSSAMEQTQTPLPIIERAQARAFSRGVIAPFGYAIAALGLAALPSHFDLRILSVLVLVTLGALLGFIGLRLRSTYVETLRRAIDDRHLRLDVQASEASGAPLLDSMAAEVVARDLVSPDADRAELAAELLADTDPALAMRLLPPGLAHPSEAVRLQVIHGLVRTQGPVPPALVALVTGDPVADVRRAAVGAVLADGAATPEIKNALEVAKSDPDPRVAAFATVARIALADPRGMEDGTALVDLLDGRRASLCRAALEALGQRAANTGAVVEALRALLGQRDDVQLGLAALEAAVRIDARAILQNVAPLLEDVETTAAAVGYLVRWGHGALEAAAGAVVGVPVAGAGPADAEPISRLLSHPDSSVRDRAGSALARILGRGRSEPLPRDIVHPLFESEVRVGFRTLSLLAGIAHDDGTPDWVVDEPFAFLGAELTLRFRAQRARLLQLLALVGGHALVGAVEVGLRRTDAASAPQLEAQIAELMEAVLPQQVARTVVPLFDRLTLRERIRAAERVGMLDRSAIDDPLSFIVRSGDRTLRLCAMISYGTRAAERFPEAHAEDSELIPMFERMRFLRSVPLLAELPGDELRRVAEVLDAEEREAGEVVFRKGDAGEDMYVIARGRVAIRDGEVELASLGPREFFGELSVLDREARSADAVAVEPTELLRLRAVDLGELMARRPQIQEQILLVLVRRLRSRNASAPA
jgi:hypothetical protein